VHIQEYKISLIPIWFGELERMEWLIKVMSGHLIHSLRSYSYIHKFVCYQWFLIFLIGINK